MENRRDFLKTIGLSLVGSPLALRSVTAFTTGVKYYWIRNDSGESIQVENPVFWALENKDQPILRRASQGLSKLTSMDGERITRLVVRRCGLSLAQIGEEKIEIHHWGKQQPDLRPFFKTHGLARPSVKVLLRNRKNETTVPNTGDV